MKSALAFLLAGFCLSLAACGGDDDAVVADSGPPPPDAAPRPDARPIVDGGLCNPVVQTFTIEPSPHVAETATVTYASNPPSSGPHYPKWARWRGTYMSPTLRREYWVHNLEHGGVVFIVNCSAAPCPDLVAQLDTLQKSLPRDPLCAVAANARTLIVDDPLLPAGIQVAASAWGATYTASCFDADSLRSFYDDHFARATENTCAEGSVP